MTERTDMQPECTCTFVQPTRESAIVKGFSYAIYIDAFEDESVIDKDCYYHGDHGTNVLTLHMSK